MSMTVVSRSSFLFSNVPTKNHRGHETALVVRGRGQDYPKPFVIEKGALAKLA